MFAVLFIWAGFFVSLRLGAKTVLTPADLALLRFILPSLCFSPILWRSRHKILATPKRYLFAIVWGAGLPFFLLSANAMTFIPVAHGSILSPGTLPLFVTAITMIFYHEMVSRQRLSGLGLILLGVGVMLTQSISNVYSSQWLGHLLILSASLSWSFFTVAMRKSGLSALEGAALFSLGSLSLLVPLLVTGVLESHIHLAQPGQILLQLLMQGVLVGLIASFCYGFAINRLGPEKTAAIGAFTPVLAGLIAIPIFAESIYLATAIGMIFVTMGTLLASQAFEIRPQAI